MTQKKQTTFHVPANPFFKKWTEILLRYKWLFLIANSMVTGFMLYQIINNMRVDNGTEAFVGDESEEVTVLEDLYDKFGQDRIYQILVAGDVFSPEYLFRLKKLHDEMAAIDIDIPSLGQRKGFSTDEQIGVQGEAANTVDEHNNADAESDDAFAGFGEDDGWGEETGGTIIEEIISLVNARQTTWKDGGLKVAGLLDDWPAKNDLPALRERVLADSSLVGKVVGKDGKHSVVILRADFMDEEDSVKLFEHVKTLARKHNTNGFKVMVSGHPAFDATLDTLMLTDFRVLTLAAVVVVFLLSFLIFRHPIGVLGPILVFLQSAIWTLGAMALTDTPMTIVTNVIPAFLACVGIGDSVHIQSVYRDARAHGKSNYEAIVRAVATTGIPVLYTTITTGLGLISFKMATLGAIEDMGIFGAIGIVCALIQSLVFLPILLSFNKKSLLGVKPGQAKRDLLDTFLGFFNDLSRARVVNGKVSHNRTWGVLGVSIAITLGFAGGASMLKMFHDPLSWIPPDREIRKSMAEMDAHVGGTASIALLIKAKEGKTVKDKQFLLKLEKLAAHIQNYKDPNNGDNEVVGVTISLLDVVKESWRAVNGEKEEYYKIPDTERGVDDMITLFENSAPDQLKQLATVDMVNTVMTVRVKWMDAGSYAPLTEYVDQGVQKIIGDAAEVKVTGTVRMVSTVIRSLLTDLVKSFGTAFLTVTIVMILLLRNIKLGLISMVPNLMPVVVIMGIMGFASIPIDMATLIIASIIIGIAVDDTIHFLHQFRIHYSINGDVDAALDHAFFHTGRAMAVTSIMLVLGFCVFLSASIYPLQRFGILAGSAIAFAFTFNVIVGPALLRVLYRKKSKNTSETENTTEPNNTTETENTTEAKNAIAIRNTATIIKGVKYEKLYAWLQRTNDSTGNWRFARGRLDLYDFLGRSN